MTYREGAEKLVYFSPLLVGLFYLQGVFYQIGVLAPYNVSTNIYSIEFHEAFIWAALFYIVSDVTWYVFGISGALFIYPFLKAWIIPKLDIWDAWGQKHFKGVFTKESLQGLKAFFERFNEKYLHASTLVLASWLVALTTIFYVPYNFGKKHGHYNLSKAKCMMTNEKGDFLFSGNDLVHFKPEADVKEDKLENVYIVSRNNHYMSIYDGKLLRNFRTDLILQDSIELDLFAEQQKSAKEIRCEELARAD